MGAHRHAIVSMRVCTWELVGVQGEAREHARGKVWLCKREFVSV